MLSPGARGHTGDLRGRVKIGVCTRQPHATGEFHPSAYRLSDTVKFKGAWQSNELKDLPGIQREESLRATSRDFLVVDLELGRAWRAALTICIQPARTL